MNKLLDCKSAGAPGQTRTGVTRLLRFGRGGEIRTPDHLVPGQVPYRWATPRFWRDLIVSLTGRAMAGNRLPPEPYGPVAAVGYSVLFAIDVPSTCACWSFSIHVALDCKTCWLSPTYPLLSKTAEFPKSHPNKPHKQKSPGLRSTRALYKTICITPYSLTYPPNVAVAS